MLVKNWMSTPVITVNVKESMEDAIKLLKRRHIKILPVLENGDLVGIITDRDLKKASASDATCLDKHEVLYLIAKKQRFYIWSITIREKERCLISIGSPKIFKCCPDP